MSFAVRVKLITQSVIRVVRLGPSVNMNVRATTWRPPAPSAPGPLRSIPTVTLLGRARVGRGARVVRLRTRLRHGATRAHFARRSLEIARLRRLFVVVLLVVAVMAALEVEVLLGGAGRGAAYLGRKIQLHYPFT